MTGHLQAFLVIAGLVLAGGAHAADAASGYFQMGDARLEVRHAIAVIEDASVDGEAGNTQLFLSAAPLDAAKVAAAFDPMDAVSAQEPAGGYIRLCIGADGNECGLFFSPEGFNLGGYGELTLQGPDAQRITGRFAIKAPGDFMGTPYQFDLDFDAAITPAPGADLPAGGGEPGQAYHAYLAALAAGDLKALRTMAGEEGEWRYPQDDPTAAKEALKSARDGQPLRVEIVRGRRNGQDAVLWVRGVDRDDIRRAGRVLMHDDGNGWRFAEADLDSVDE